ncbi:MAG TPA: hypothetical protein ENK86_00410 [Campylobacterales bacterium]|nr:hypothetical protein [Campylobacterales bacterium]
MTTTHEENYAFPRGFNLGDLILEGNRMPLLTPSEDGGFCLLYDDVSEKKADALLESLSLQLLEHMPLESLRVEMFDFGRKKFYHLSPLQYLSIYRVSHDDKMIAEHFEELEHTIITRHQELLCCNRPNLNAHNQKSKLKQNYHLVLINLHHFPTTEIELRRIKNFVESAVHAGVYVIAFGNQEIETSGHEGVQTILKHFKNLRVTNNEFEITSEIFEHTQVFEVATFEPLDLARPALLEQIMTNANPEERFAPESIKLETDTKVMK